MCLWNELINIFKSYSPQQRDPNIVWHFKIDFCSWDLVTLETMRHSTTCWNVKDINNCKVPEASRKLKTWYLRVTVWRHDHASQDLRCDDEDIITGTCRVINMRRQTMYLICFTFQIRIKDLYHVPALSWNKRLCTGLNLLTLDNRRKICLVNPWLSSNNLERETMRFHVNRRMWSYRTECDIHAVLLPARMPFD